MTIKLPLIFSSLIFFLFIFTSSVFAHVIVTPKQVGIGATQVFDTSVPNEKSTPTVSIRLVIPDGLQSVVPNSKPGWTISIKKNGETVTEIDWTGGTILPEQRDDFYFQAQVPVQPVTLHWKAYQSYQDGSVVSWINPPTSNPEDDSAPPPYSTTTIINDLKSPTPLQIFSNENDKSSRIALAISILAILLSLVTLGLEVNRKRK